MHQAYIAGVGGITLTSNSTGSTGATGTSGGIFIRFDATTSANLPTGRLFYDLELNNSGEITRLIEGRFESKRKHDAMNKLEVWTKEIIPHRV